MADRLFLCTVETTCWVLAEDQREAKRQAMYAVRGGNVDFDVSECRAARYEDARPEEDEVVWSRSGAVSFEERYWPTPPPDPRQKNLFAEGVSP